MPNNITTAALTLLLVLASCGGGSPRPQPPPAPVTITEPMSYLAQSRGTLGNSSTPLRDTDPMVYRRRDVGGYQIEDSFLTGPNTAITTWDYPQFGVYSRAEGDGGEEFVLEGNAVRISATVHGISGEPTAYFVGKNCGGTGWLLFRTDAVETWRDAVARLSISTDPNACAARSQAYTRYRRTTVAYPGVGPVDTIISEHHNAGTLASSTAAEIFFMGRGWGRLAWLAFDANRLPSPDIATRCPDFGFNTPPTPSLRLVDCRIVTNIIPADRPVRGADMWRP
jgi:hypothetical protein